MKLGWECLLQRGLRTSRQPELLRDLEEVVGTARLSSRHMAFGGVYFVLLTFVTQTSLSLSFFPLNLR